jgi:hypothetical protein
VDRFADVFGAALVAVAANALYHARLKKWDSVRVDELNRLNVHGQIMRAAYLHIHCAVSIRDFV